MDQLVTLFGGGGFLGRYVAQALLQGGARVRIASRDPSVSHYLRPQGGIGQTGFVAADVTKPESVARAVAGSTAVVNLVGILKGDFERFHVDGARNVAEAAAAAGAGALVQVSAIGADAAAASAYARSKGEGERAVLAAFPKATIVRPSILFGPEDQFVNRFARMAQIMPVLPVVGGSAKFQPAWVADAARAIAAAALDPGRYGGQVYELGGPEVIGMEALNRWIVSAIGAKRPVIAIPDEIGALIAKAGSYVPGAPITWDQWLMLRTDNVVSPGAQGFAAFGIQPTPLATVAGSWLVRYRRGGRFSKTQRAG